MPRGVKREGGAEGRQPRCVIYVRTAVADREGARRQHERAVAFVRERESRSWTLEEPVYEDVGASGLNLVRPGLNRLLADAEAGRFKIVVISDVARLARDIVLVRRLARRLEACGVTVSVVPPPGGDEALAVGI